MIREHMQIYEISYRPKEWKTSITSVTFGKKEKVDNN